MYVYRQLAVRPQHEEPGERAATSPAPPDEARVLPERTDGPEAAVFYDVEDAPICVPQQHERPLSTAVYVTLMFGMLLIFLLGFQPSCAEQKLDSRLEQRAAQGR